MTQLPSGPQSTDFFHRLRGKLCAKIMEGQRERGRGVDSKKEKKFWHRKQCLEERPALPQHTLTKAFLSGAFHLPVSGPYEFPTDSDLPVVS